MSEDRSEGHRTNSGRPFDIRTASAPLGKSESGSRAVVSDDGVIEQIVTEALVSSGIDKPSAQRVAAPVVELLASYHSGPLPPASELVAHEQACEGAARDILNMAKSDQAHAHRMDTIKAVGTIIITLSGMLTTALISVILVGGAIYAAVIGQKEVAIAIVTGTGLIGAAAAIGRMISRPKEKPTPPKSSAPRRRRK